MTDPRTFTIVYLPRDLSEPREARYLADGSSPEQALDEALERLYSTNCDPIEARDAFGEVIWTSSRY